MARAHSDSEAKSSPEIEFASLGPTLLARKGGAKPAMRPQIAALPDIALVDPEMLEDLGWNDMGEAREYGGARRTSSEKRSAKKAKKAAASKKSELAFKAAEKSGSKPVKRAAFTLRLDADRHLKLRLAATMHGMSAQALVTEAIDAMFNEIEDLDALAKRMKRN
ncbi:hypothetical protein EH31_09260 [Erythrobacter longus]|uniref:Uncharacterized protein n=1 Tax=Erythrobacter longus TaxID=1044 RepID=A0A074MXC9_ERYLO|nr:hypothetical protein [Erythrobacter longus]KEO90267.1 hypothetical protein EH31_09260 [Erythrobacter longus]